MGAYLQAGGLALMRALCAETELAEGATLAFPAAPGSLFGLFAMRHGGQIRVFVNSCPHLGVGLDWLPNRFLDVAGTHIVCSTHGALFTLDTGVCVAGPCQGDALEQVAFQLEGGMVLVADDAGI